ncbi:MAG: response regulator [bacterium]|nr:response regulator [bacterium]
MTEDQTKLAALKVLIVDDHMTARAHLKRVLRDMGITQADEAENADAATAKANAGYNIIFLDWDMPGKTGIEILRKFRGNSAFDDTAFVMVTAKSEPDDIISSLRAGATSYIVKPADPADVRNNVAEVLEWIEQQKSLRR